MMIKNYTSKQEKLLKYNTLNYSNINFLKYEKKHDMDKMIQEAFNKKVKVVNNIKKLPISDILNTLKKGMNESTFKKINFLPISLNNKKSIRKLIKKQSGVATFITEKGKK